jgi:energy-coupling factor transport system substrate-specific component
MKGLSSRDLITIGIFNAVSIVLYIVIGIATMPVPLLHILAVQPLAAIVCGAVFLLLATKVQKQGIFLVSGLLYGIIFSILMGLYATLILGPLFGFIADKVCGDYKSSIKMSVGYSVFMLGLYYGQIFFFFFFTDWFLALFEGNALAHKQTVTQVMTGGMLGIMTVVILLTGALGGFIGTKMLKKHFIKAGVV